MLVKLLWLLIIESMPCFLDHYELSIITQMAAFQQQSRLRRDDQVACSKIRNALFIVGYGDFTFSVFDPTLMEIFDHALPRVSKWATIESEAICLEEKSTLVDLLINSNYIIIDRREIYLGNLVNV